VASVTIDLAGLDGWTKEQAKKLTDAQLRRPLRVCEQLVMSDTKARFGTGTDPDGKPWRPVKFRVRGAGKPLYDTGRLVASIRARVQGSTLTVGTNLAYAKVHQFGAVITPKKGRYLTIPLSVEAQRAGSPRRMNKLHRRGRALFDAKGKAHWALVLSVKIPARPYLGFGQKVIKQIRDVFRKHLAGGK
jgi:phage gpG-like protein